MITDSEHSEQFLVCTGCYWIAPFGRMPRDYFKDFQKDHICNICESEVKVIHKDPRDTTWYDNCINDISNDRCGNGYGGATDKDFATLLLYGDKNDIEHWINPLPKVL